MPRNPFEQKADTESDASKPTSTATCVENGNHKAGKGEHEPANGENNMTANRQEAGKGHNSVEGPVGPETN